jgi:hypothetical protein
MAYIKCNSCGKDVKKFTYEIKGESKNRVVDINKYVCQPCKIKNAWEERTCPICSKTFAVRKIENKKTCSYSCSNKLFRTGENNGNWKENAYRTTCFSKHEKKCIICDETNIVEVHHYDQNKKNNKPENLIPLCPTHHQYVHSRFSCFVVPLIEKYREMFIKLNIT